MDTTEFGWICFTIICIAAIVAVLVMALTGVFH